MWWDLILQLHSKKSFRNPSTVRFLALVCNFICFWRCEAAVNLHHVCWHSGEHGSRVLGFSFPFQYSSIHYKKEVFRPASWHREAHVACSSITTRQCMETWVSHLPKYKGRGRKMNSFKNYLKMSAWFDVSPAVCGMRFLRGWNLQGPDSPQELLPRAGESEIQTNVRTATWLLECGLVLDPV